MVNRLHEEFIGPRFFVHVAALEMHPLDTEDRLEEIKENLTQFFQPQINY